MKHIQSFLHLLFLFPLILSCSKSDNNNSPLSEKGKKLVAGEWQISGYTAKTTYMGQDTIIDLYPSMAACEKDNVVRFLSNGTLIEDEKSNLCFGQSQVSQFPWALLNNDTRIALVDSNPDTFDIIQITDAQWTFEKKTLNSSGMQVTGTWTYQNIK
jgi:hypothetical protein